MCALVALLAGAVSAVPRVAIASSHHSSPAVGRTIPRQYWNPAWRRAGPLDYTLGGIALTAAAFEVAVLYPCCPPSPPRWHSPILFDTAVRNAIRISSASDRATVEKISWIPYLVIPAYPLFDLAFAWTRGGPALAREFFWQDMVVLSLAGSIDLALRDVVARARPDLDDCLNSGNQNCPITIDNTRSFPGGHFAFTMAAAGLICTQHLRTHLYGGPWDAFVCGAAVAGTITEVTLRLASDAHYATDFIAGGLLGSVIGWGVPALMYYSGHSEPPLQWTNGTTTVFPSPVPIPEGAGLGLAGAF